MPHDLTFWAAAAAGLFSFFSPCVFPLMPLYLAVVAPGGAGRGRLAGFAGALSFAAGFTLIFIFLGLTASALGAFLTEHRNALRKAGALLMIGMGFFQLGIISPGFLLRERRPFLETAGRNGGAFILGMAFVFGWIPCTSPVLGAILIYAGTQENVFYGAFLLAAYSAGFSLPLLLAALATGNFTRRLRWAASPWLEPAQKLAGLVIIAVGALLYINKLSQIIIWFY
ncbi:MAG: cytochrome c biogenesis CcdA family protein [Acidaminococcales bacterium]|jgi:cytochrome c-type biogenesis protein|nr:cytochrome c biogenesis CcdA family protein [Acidaminococcales bacterium]